MGNETDYLDMSDEDFESTDVPDFNKLAEELAEEKDVNTDETVEDETNDSEEELKDKEEDFSEEVKEDLVDPEEESTEETETEEEDPKVEEITKEEFDYKKAYEALLSPIKANGKEIQLKSAEDLIRLAQMGANYHKKMSGIKPARKALKTLENNNLLDEEKLALLIDASKGKPEAITKLIREHNIDPLDLDMNTATDYTPSDYSVSDSEIEIDTVLDSIQGSSNYNQTIDLITNKWDDTSRERVAANPHIIKIINEHMDTGTYNTVMGEVDYQRSLGYLQGVSDIDAYGQMGNKLEQEGKLTTVKPIQATTVKVAKPVVNPIKDEQRKAKKRAASPTKQSSKTSKLPSDFNPLDLSDEEFEKFDPKLIGIK